MDIHRIYHIRVGELTREGSTIVGLGLGSYQLQDLALEVSKLPRKFSNCSQNVPEGSFFLLEMAPGLAVGMELRVTPGLI